MAGTTKGLVRWAALAAALHPMASGACLYHAKKGEGGGQTSFSGSRKLEPSDVALPRGYRIRAVATGLTFPTGITFDERGRLYVTEAGYSYPDTVTTPRLLRLEGGDRLVEIARGDNPPWNGVAFHEGAFYVAGGHVRPGQILRIGSDGRTTVLVDGMQNAVGDHHVNGPVIRDGYVYFSQGPLTNSGVVGTDNFEFGWLARHPQAHDIPCKDVVVAAQNVRSKNPLTPDPDDEVETGPFVPFGTRVSDGQVIRGQVPCGGAVMRVPLGGGAVELVAWGLRNTWGLAFGPDGTLYATENQFDDRGSRPVWGTGDLLWAIKPGTWYGWPDFWAGRALTRADWFRAPGAAPLGFLLKQHPAAPPEPTAFFGVHASANGIDVSRRPSFGYVGQAFVAEFGDIAPKVGKVLAPVGFKVVRVELDTGVVHDFAVNVGQTNGPASWQGSGGLERPVNVRFSPDGDALYIVDFGALTVREGKLIPHPRTGVVWRIERAVPGGAS